MLHRHVETLFDHWVLVIQVASRPHDRLGASWVVETSQSLWLKSLLAGVEHNWILELFATWLIHSLWSLIVLILVLSRSRDIELKALAEVSLVEVEPWRSCIETDSLTDSLLIVRGSSLFVPIAFSWGSIAHACNLILNSKILLVLVDHLFILSLHDYLLSWVTVASK